MRNKKNLLIFIRYLNGHGQVLCSLLTRYFLQKGYSVTIATAGFLESGAIQTVGGKYLGRYENEDFNILFIKQKEIQSLSSTLDVLKLIVRYQKQVQSNITFIDNSIFYIVSKILNPCFRDIKYIF